MKVPDYIITNLELPDAVASLRYNPEAVAILDESVIRTYDADAWAIAKLYFQRKLEDGREMPTLGTFVDTARGMHNILLYNRMLSGN